LGPVITGLRGLARADLRAREGDREGGRAARRRARERSRRSGPGRPRRVRRLLALAAALLAGAGAAVLVTRDDRVNDAYLELTLPLRHEDIIRQQAEDKDLDAALIAAVIYEESRFRDRTSPAGAKGLMQIVPGTARFIASRSGGTAFELRDLGTPQVNIAYGSWYLRYLLERYDGDVELAVAAYNAGARNVDRWVEDAGGVDEFEPNEHIGYPETRAYVAGVTKHRDDYARNYERELGL
jgi:soluble lytic murein transglycosylase